MKQIEKIAEACVTARKAQIPVVYLLTDEMELLDELVNGEYLVPLLHDDRNKGVSGHPVFKDIRDVFEADQKKDKVYKSIGEVSIHNIKFSTQVEAEPFYQMAKGKLHVFPYDVQSFCVGSQLCIIKNYDLLARNDTLAKTSVDNLIKYINQYISARPEDGIKTCLLILAASTLRIPEGLEDYIEVVEVPSLTDEEIGGIIMDFLKSKTCEEVPHRLYLNQLILSLKGFGSRKIKEILHKIFFEMGGITLNLYDQRKPEKVVQDIVEREKKQMLEKSGILKNKEIGDKEVGGLDYLKTWIRNRKRFFENSKTVADEWDINVPKGALVSGIPGTGKSLMAEEIARTLGIPLIQMDMGALMGKYLGESENNMRKAIEMAEALTPCVLWIDEIEKAFSSVGSSSDNDSGTSKRTFATFLTWLQEKTVPCFVFATANNTRILPAEFLRRGRFDQKFYTFMPTKRECIDIFKTILEGKNGYGRKFFDVQIISDSFLGEVLVYCGCKGKFLTGADISGIINDAKMFVYLEEVDRMGTDKRYTVKNFKPALLKAIDESRPYGETNMDDIASCFISLYENKFMPAAKRNILDFSDFHPKELQCITSACKENNGYDELLYELIKERVNAQCKTAQRKEGGRHENR